MINNFKWTQPTSKTAERKTTKYHWKTDSLVENLNYNLFSVLSSFLVFVSTFLSVTKSYSVFMPQWVVQKVILSVTERNSICHRKLLYISQKVFIPRLYRMLSSHLISQKVIQELVTDSGIKGNEILTGEVEIPYFKDLSNQ